MYMCSFIRSENTLSTSTMLHVPITNLFNAYDLQPNPYEKDRISSQEVVNYCEARFRVALQEIMKRSDADQEWMLKVLYQELVLLLNNINAEPNLIVVLGMLFFLCWCGCCSRLPCHHSSSYPVARPGHVPDRHGSKQEIPTRPRTYRLSRWKYHKQWTQ